jgi:hypothetical protein
MVEACQTFEVHLTPASVDDLKLNEGAQVWMVVKTYSCNLVQPSPGADCVAALGGLHGQTRAVRYKR